MYTRVDYITACAKVLTKKISSTQIATPPTPPMIRGTFMYVCAYYFVLIMIYTLVIKENDFINEKIILFYIRESKCYRNS